MTRADRRTFLRSAAAAGAALSGWSLAPALARAAARPERRTRRVVLVAFAGGVRTRETLDTPANVPNLAALAAEGVVYPRARCANLGHFGAALTVFTGVGEARGIRENARGPHPTVFEYVRKDLGLPAGEVWISTSGGAQQVNYSHGTHPDWGARYGANTLDGDGVFNEEFQGLVQRYGRPRAMDEGEQALLERMRASLGGAEGAADDAGARRMESFILQELSGGTVDLAGANAADAKALRVARNVLSLFKPTLLGVVLRDADIAHGNYNAYAEVVRRNDAALGELLDAIRGDPELADSTAVVVVPEFGRDRDLNARRGLDHGDGSDELLYVSCLCWGPDFRRGRIVQREVGVVDVAPTVCEVLGARAPLARGSVLPELFA